MIQAYKKIKYKEFGTDPKEAHEGLENFVYLLSNF